MKIFVTGGTGFIGKNLTKALLNEGHHLFILTRYTIGKVNSENVTYIKTFEK
ncbi:MAG: hypothetical protein OHK0040_14040 [bacterium]